MLHLKNKSTLASWEGGKAEPDIIMFLSLCLLYDIPEAELLRNKIIGADSELEKSIEYRLRLYRKIKGFTQADLGRKIGVSQSTIALYETGAVSPTLKILEQISHTLKVPLKELIL